MILRIRLSKLKYVDFIMELPKEHYYLNNSFKDISKINPYQERHVSTSRSLQAQRKQYGFL
jgi:hypothetical protein